MQRLPGEDGVGEAAERVRVADEGGRARHAGEGSSLEVRVFTPTPAASLLQASQKDSNFRLEEKLRDTNNWRGELQAEMDAVTQETDQLLETRSSCRDSCSPAAANSCLLPQVPAAGQHRADPAPAARHHGVPDGAGGAARGGQGAGPGEYWPVIGQQAAILVSDWPGGGEPGEGGGHGQVPAGQDAGPPGHSEYL